MNGLEAWLRDVPWPVAAAVALAENVVVLGLAVGTGHAFRVLCAHRPLTQAPPLTKLEWTVGAAAVVLNAAVTLAGLALWRRGILHFRNDVGLRALLDVLVLVLVMDFAMYILHRFRNARSPWRRTNAIWFGALACVASPG